MSGWTRIVAHADMDAFYAAVEQLDDPNLRGKPILVGPNSPRGVVLTASYEARPYGVGSAMPIAAARRLCPQAIIVPPRFERYEEISKHVMHVLGDFSPAVEPLSLDEAFLDVSGSAHIFGAPAVIGQKIKNAVREATRLDISVGISATKYVAKVASGHAKPNGLVLVPPHRAAAWLAPLPVGKLWGVGKKTTAKLQALGLATIGDVANSDERELRQHFGVGGSQFFQLAHAIDPRPVIRGRASKSIGSERTLSEDISSREDIERHLRRAAQRVARRLRAKHYVAGGVRVRLKTTRFEMLTRQIHLTKPTDTAAIFFAVSQKLLADIAHLGPFRLVGLAAFDLDWHQQALQSDLFEDKRQRELETMIDYLRERFGDGAVRRARDLIHDGTLAERGVNLDFLDHREEEKTFTSR